MPDPRQPENAEPAPVLGEDQVETGSGSAEADAESIELPLEEGDFDAQPG